MTKQEILDRFKDINEAYNNCSAYDDLSAMLDELIETEQKKTEEERKQEAKQRRSEYNRKYRETHRERAYQELKEWRKNNPEKWKAQKAREREKKKQKRMEGDGK